LNFDEGKQFVRELITAFPAFESVAKDSPDIAATHRSWIAAWSDLELSESRLALSKLIKVGGIGWDDYRAPGPFVRSLVMRDRKNAPKSEEELAIEQEARRERLRAKRDYAGSPMAQALATALGMKKRGCSRAEIDIFILESV
jgi:hypothetical protein